MGGECRITLYAPDLETARTAAIVEFDRVEAVEQASSDWRDLSEVRHVGQRLSERPGGTATISQTLVACLSRSHEV